MSVDAKQRGFTLIELLIGLTVFFFSVGAVGALLLDSSRVNRTQQMAMMVQADARNCLEMVTSVLRTAGWDPRNVGISAVTLNASTPASADFIKVRADLDEDGATTGTDEAVHIRLNGNRLEWQKTTGLSFVVLADDITNDADGDGVAEMMFTPDSTTAPTKITVTITARSPAKSPQTGQYIRYTVTDVVALRGTL